VPCMASPSPVNAGNRPQQGLKRLVEPGKLLQGRWRVSRDVPFYDDEISTVIRVRDINGSKDACMKIYRGNDPYTVQKFRRSVEALLTFRGRFTSQGCRVEGSTNLDLVLEELRAHASFAEYAAGQSFLTHMDFRHAFAEIICFSHDRDWMPAMDTASNLFFIVMEVPELSLRERLTDCIAQKVCMPQEEINHIHWALTCMVCGLMTEGYLHLDIKPATVFRFKDQRGKDKWKLIDLDGIALCGSQMRFQDLNYTVEYAPPELAKLYLASQREGGRVKLARSMNVWSIGMALLEVAALMPVYDAKFSWYQKWKEDTKTVGKFLATVAGDRHGLGMEKMITDELRQALTWVSPDLCALMEGIFVKDEKKRFTITQCLLHKWFTPRRKAVHDARWGVEEEEDEELGAGQKEDGEAPDDKTEKKKKAINVGLDILPPLETNEQLRQYIRAQVEGREYRPEDATVKPGQLAIATKGGQLAIAAKGEEPPPLMLPEPPDKNAGKSKACVVM